MGDLQPSAPRPWSEWRILFWFIWFGLAVLVFGPPYLEAFHPPASKVGDFHQEWLSARNFSDGGSVYAPQHEIAARHLGIPQSIADSLMPWNAHPPVSVLLALPLGRMSCSDAQLVWNLANLPFLILAIVLVIRSLEIPFPAPAILPLLTVLIGWHSLYSQIQHAQLNILLAGLLTATWVLERNGRSAAAGAALGTAAALKLFPAFVFLYFLANRNWRAIAGGAFAFLALNGLALIVLGGDAFQTYVRDVVPSLIPYQSSRQNVSLSGFWLRLFDPRASEHVIALVQIPLLATAGILAGRIAVVGLVAWRTALARSHFERDRAFGLALAGMLLVSPITWPHYFLVLILPLAFLWQQLRGRIRRCAFLIIFALLWLPNYYFPSLALGKENGMTLFLLAKSDVSPMHNLTLMSLPHYALVGLFVLLLTIRDPAATVPPKIAP